ncbi:MAG: rubredoxin-like domain-containing protein [Promethearchaeota archaeon]|jgi:rubrerythrin
MKWKCDKCGETFKLDDIPEKYPKCGAEENTFSLVD